MFSWRNAQTIYFDYLSKNQLLMLKIMLNLTQAKFVLPQISKLYSFALL